MTCRCGCSPPASTEGIVKAQRAKGRVADLSTRIQLSYIAMRGRYDRRRQCCGSPGGRAAICFRNRPALLYGEQRARRSKARLTRKCLSGVRTKTKKIPKSSHSIFILTSTGRFAFLTAPIKNCGNPLGAINDTNSVPGTCFQR